MYTCRGTRTVRYIVDEAIDTRRMLQIPLTSAPKHLPMAAETMAAVALPANVKDFPAGAGTPRGE